MATKSQQPKEHDDALSTLNLAIEGLNLAKESSCIAPAKAAFGSVGVLLAMIRDSVANNRDYIELGLDCADICTALSRGTNCKKVEDLSWSVNEAINQLTTAVARIQSKVTEQGQRNRVSRFFHAKNDKENIEAWKLELNRILHVFQTELAINTHVTLSDTQNTASETHHMVSEIHRAAMKHQGEPDGWNLPTRASVLGEYPPPPPRACFGRDELVEKVVNLAENLKSVALIGAGGIGKTSIALAVLHHHRIKKRFGENRRFIRCEQFPPSRSHFLNRLSRAIGAGIENPEDLTPLRPFLSSREMILFLDNLESILDPQGPDAREIYNIVEELSRFTNICLGITSRVSTVPPGFKRPIISTLSMESACDIFYGIYENGSRSDVINDLVKQLDFHALSITLLATTASHNMWGYDRLAKEWNEQRSQILRTDYHESLAAAIELSLTSPTFRNLGPDARNLLEIVAFFPQGVDEDNLAWLFPTTPDRRDVFNNFCVLSLTFRSDNSVTMLAPIRDYLRPKDPKSSPLLCTAKDRYFSRLEVYINPSEPGFAEARWITSEDVNVEHLLDVFTSIDVNSDVIWDVCANFLRHLYWHKARHTVLGRKIEGLPDGHRSKPAGLMELSSLYGTVGKIGERKRLLVHALKLYREQKNNNRIALTLCLLSDANRVSGLCKEGIQQAKEALEIYERLGNTVEQANCLADLARLFRSDNQLDAAKEAASRAIALLPERGQEYKICQCHRTLGQIYGSKGKAERAISHYKTALRIASNFKWRDELFWNHYALARLFLEEGGFNDAHTHIEQAKSHVVDDIYKLGRAMKAKATIWYQQRQFMDATSEALGALEIYEKLGASNDVGRCKHLLRDIERALAGDEPPFSASRNISLSRRRRQHTRTDVPFLDALALITR